MATGIAIGMRGICAAAYEFLNVFRGSITAGTYTYPSGNLREVGYSAAPTTAQGSITSQTIGDGLIYFFHQFESLQEPEHIWHKTNSQFFVRDLINLPDQNWLVQMIVNGKVYAGSNANTFSVGGSSPDYQPNWQWWQNANPSVFPYDAAGVGAFNFVDGVVYPVTIIHK